VYWFTMIAAGTFIAAVLVGVQGLATALLPRRHFLRASPILQLTAFAALVGGYLLQPITFNAEHLVSAQGTDLLAASPSYWFLGLFQSLSGSPALPVLATRAWIGLGVALAIAIAAYALSYVQTLRGIAEQPVVAISAPVHGVPLLSHGPGRALLDFTLKTLSRSGPQRVVMAFYWGLGFAFAVAFLKSPRGSQIAGAIDVGAWYETSLPLQVASILMMGAAVLAARNAFAIPRDFPANWVFRMVPLREGRVYAAARRRAMIAVSVVPVCAISAIACLLMWPWLPAVGHLAALAVLGVSLVEIADHGTRRIPFTCSYLPGRSQVHVRAIVVMLVVVPLVVGAASLERDALRDGWRYVLMMTGLVSAVLAARSTVGLMAANLPPAFEAEPDDRVATLELWDGVRPLDTAGRRVSPGR
jgi:hypothetical protein